jgi:hypothetical protein
MKLGTKARILGSFASFSLALSSGCDRGIAPECADGDTTCVASTGLSAGIGGGGSGTNQGGTKPDTAKGGIGDVAGTWEPAYDTGANIKSVARNDFIGIPVAPNGDARRIVFYVTDSTLRIAASSDGGSVATSNRQTTYEVRVLCTDSIRFGWDTKTDNELSPKAATGVDPLTVFEPKPLSLTVLEMPVITKTLEAHLTARRGSTFLVWVKARSGYRLAGNAVAIPEDSLPRLNIAQTRALLFSGAALAPIPSDPFTLQLP